MKIKKARLGILLSSVTALWSGTVVSYNDSPDFTLEVTTDTGDINDVEIGLAIALGGDLVRIRAIDTSGPIVITLAENGITFTAGQSVFVFNVRYPFPRYQRIGQEQTLSTTVGTPGQVTNPDLTGVSEQNAGSDFRMWWQLNTVGRVSIFRDSGFTDKVARAKTITGGTTLVTEKNASGISGTIDIVVPPTTEAEGFIDSTEFKLFKDFDIAWEDNGIDNPERSKATQGPIAIVTPEAVQLDVDETQVFDASNSFATYNGWNFGSRNPAGVSSFAWNAGTGGTIVSGGTTPTPTIKWTTSGFRYLKLTITDSNGTIQERYVPVWVGITPFSVTGATSRCNLFWRLNQGWVGDIEFQVEPLHLRYSLVAVVDLEEDEIIFLGFLWPESVRFNFEKQSLSFTALSDLAYLANVYSYPFELVGQKGDPITWNDFDMLSVPRSIYFLLRWHSNYLEIANATYDTSSENRLMFRLEYTAGTILEQLNTMAAASFFGVYGSRLGGFVAEEKTLYLSTITDAAGDAITLDLTNTDITEMISFDRATQQISEATLSGWFHDINLDFFPIIVRAPIHPNHWGKPIDIPGLVDKGPGRNELLRWAGRHIGIENFSDRYTFRSITDFDLSSFRMVDLPDTTRVFIEEKRLDFDVSNLTWLQVLTGRTFGQSVSSTVGTTYDPPNIPDEPPVIPEEEEPPRGDGNVFAIGLREQFKVQGNTFTFDSATNTITDSGSGFSTVKIRPGDEVSIGGTVSVGNNGAKTVVSVTSSVLTVDSLTVDETPALTIIINVLISVAITDEFITSALSGPIWQLVDVPLASDANPNRYDFMNIAFAQGGDEPDSLYISIRDNSATPDILSLVFYNVDPFGSGVFTPLLPTTPWIFGGNGSAFYAPGTVLQPSPFESGEMLMNVVTPAATFDPKRGRGFVIFTNGVETNGPGKWGEGSTAIFGVETNHVNWDYVNEGQLITGSFNNVTFGGVFMLRIPKTSTFAFGEPAATFFPFIISGPSSGDHQPDWPLRLIGINIGASQPTLAATGGGSYSVEDTSLLLRYGDSDFIRTSVGAVSDIGMLFNHGIRLGQNQRAPGILAFIDSATLIIEQGNLASRQIVTLPGNPSNIQNQVVLYGSNGDTESFVTVLEGTSSVGGILTSLQTRDITGAIWTDRLGNLASIISGETITGLNSLAVLWGDVSSL